MLRSGTSSTIISPGAVVSFAGETVSALSNSSGIAGPGVSTATFGRIDQQVNGARTSEGVAGPLKVYAGESRRLLPPGLTWLRVKLVQRSSRWSVRPEILYSAEGTSTPAPRRESSLLLP